tara:strand:+ start:488 stop:1102 length:615 start_codon:yes stop_codon:yes gene_type:complete
MKKLIYLFLTVLIVACSGEDSNNSNNNSNNSYNVDYFFEVEFGGVINRVQGNTSNQNSFLTKNKCYAATGNQWGGFLSISDITDVSYVSGQNMELFFILDDAQLGSNTGRIGQLYGNYIIDYLETIGAYWALGFKENGTGERDEISNINITDLGTQPTSTNTGLDYGETLKVTYEGVLYFLSLDTNQYDIPAPIRIEFNAVRIN